MSKHKEYENHKAWHREHYNAAGINDKLVLNLRDLSHIMRFLYEGKGSQKRILIILEDIGGCVTQQELTERLGIRPGSVSEVIAKLEGMGYISRTPNETDRRTVDIVLTESGKIAAEKASAQRRQRHEEMFSCLTEDEKNEMLMLLEKVNEDWTARYQGSEDFTRSYEHHHRKHGHHAEEHHGENLKKERNSDEKHPNGGYYKELPHSKGE